MTIMSSVQNNKMPLVQYTSCVLCFCQCIWITKTVAENWLRYLGKTALNWNNLNQNPKYVTKFSINLSLSWTEKSLKFGNDIGWCGSRSLFRALGFSKAVYWKTPLSPLPNEWTRLSQVL